MFCLVSIGWLQKSVVGGVRCFILIGPLPGPRSCGGPEARSRSGGQTPIPRDRPRWRRDTEFCRIEHRAENAQVQDLLWQEIQYMSAIVASVVPKTIPVHPVRNCSSRTIIHGSADQINHSAVGCGIEPQGDLFFLCNGFDKLFVIWYHNVDGFECFFSF